MPQTKRRRRRKHRGTQGGSVDRRRAGRPRSRQEARARARGTLASRQDRPPTWRGAFNRAFLAAAIFLGLVLLIFRQPVGSAIAVTAVILAFYVPAGYYFELFLYRRRMARRQREREPDG